MKKASPYPAFARFLFGIILEFRRLLPKKRCQAFDLSNSIADPMIRQIFVINLERQPDRLTEMRKELKQVLDYSGNALWSNTERFNAIDAAKFLQDPVKDEDVDPHYTLNDQLLIEPQPLALPTQMELNSPIQMSRPEIAVARSHIEVWRQLVTSKNDYILVLEDDIWLRPGFAKSLTQAWTEIVADNIIKGYFDIFYLSYEEVKHGAPKTFLSKKIFRPERGLWNLSGYVISRTGAEKLLRYLPCRGPIDLWLNHQFKFLDVYAIKKSIISQRPDFSSTNSYSILPALTKIGAITSESASLFHVRPTERPVFVFGPKESGLSSLSMALSMLGYRCCSDLSTIPSLELDGLLSGSIDRVFDAYVNIGSLALEAANLKKLYPQAKFILTTNKNADINNDIESIGDFDGVDVAIVPKEAFNKWQIICEHLRCAPPACSFPELPDLGQRQLRGTVKEQSQTSKSIVLKRDKSPWQAEPNQMWLGIDCFPNNSAIIKPLTCINDYLETLDTKQWLLREDTFTDNLGLFRPNNIEILPDLGFVLKIKKENLGVREYSAASLTSSGQYLYGRFEATIKPSNVPGVVTGFFLHRDSPRQEIDIEIAGNRTNRLIVNVFYNPGSEGDKFDYGYRGAPTYIDLGFDASESYHQFAIEWEPNEIRWYVDDRLVHRRVEWNPTPIPHLPMSLHLNIWPCRSRELAGRLSNRNLPATTLVRSITLKAHDYEPKENYENTSL